MCIRDSPLTSSPPIHLLYIDDDDVDVMAMKRAIAHSKTGFSLLVARDGIEALALLRGQGVPRPHIVLLDLNMPRMNGIEFLRQLREDQEHRDAVVFVLTTSSMTEDKACLLYTSRCV